YQPFIPLSALFLARAMHLLHQRRSCAVSDSEKAGAPGLHYAGPLYQMRCKLSENHVEYALKYAERGWAVIPVHYITNGKCSCGKPSCNSPGKHPRTLRGFHEATIDEGKIKHWWSLNPLSNIGIRTGPESGIWILD